MTLIPAHVRDRTLALVRELRSFLGTLVVVPLVVVVFGSHWSWDRSVAPTRIWKIGPGATPSDRGEEVRLHFYEDGSDPGRGVELGDGSVLLVELPQEVSRFEVVLQVDPNDFYVVLGGLLIVAAVSFMTWREHVLKRRATTPAASATKV